MNKPRSEKILEQLIKSENEVDDLYNYDLENLENYVILSFASNKKMEEYRKQKGYSICNPFTLLVFAYFKIVSNEYIHVEISFRPKQQNEKLVAFTVSNDTKVVRVITRQFSEAYLNYSVSIDDDQKATIFSFLRSRRGMSFDRIGSFRMPFFPESNYEKEGRTSYYCVSLVILALQSIGLMNTLVCNCVSIDELLDFVRFNDIYRITAPPKVFSEDHPEALRSLVLRKFE